MDGVPQGGRSGQRATFGRHPYLYIVTKGSPSGERERQPVCSDLCKASHSALYKNLKDGMSLCDRAGLYPLPKGTVSQSQFVFASDRRERGNLNALKELRDCFGRFTPSQ
jgi:hypothetical protein